MGCTYVKDFDFGPQKTYVKAYAHGGPAKKADCGCGGPVMKAKGGKMVEKATGEVYPSRKVMEKHERAETPTMQREELVQKAEVRAPRRRVPVASASPLIIAAQR